MDIPVVASEELLEGKLKESVLFSKYNRTQQYAYLHFFLKNFDLHSRFSTRMVMVQFQYRS